MCSRVATVRVVRINTVYYIVVYSVCPRETLDFSKKAILRRVYSAAL